MSQVELLKKLYTRTKTYKIPKDPKEGQEQVELVFHGLSMETMTEVDTEKVGKEDIFKLLAKSLDCSIEEVKPIAVEHMGDLMDAFEDMNNMDALKENKKVDIKAIIAQKKAALEASKK